MSVLQGLRPDNVFSFFEEICSIPHGSGNTKEISDYCVRFAKERSLRFRQDDSNNVIIWKDGTIGYEKSAPVMLQGHLDMVCVQDPDCRIDMEREGLQLQVQGTEITAKGTSLGGDDGIAIAMALAILDAEDIPHPPLEAVFTVDEEIGMLGASALDCADLQSRIMLNLDSEEEGYLLVSCAGGVTAQAHMPVQYEEDCGCRGEIVVTGLLGGHSGMEIDKGRGNACQILGRVLYQISTICDVRLQRLDGGVKDNAIPREARACICLKAHQVDRCVEEIEKIKEELRHEYALTDAGLDLQMSFAPEEENVSVMTGQSEQRVVAALMNLPGGIQKMSFSMKGIVQTSLNLGIMETKDNEVSFSFSVRSSVESEKQALVQQITCLTKILGGTVSCQGDYPAWEYRQNSPLRELMVQIYKEKYDREPVVQSMHAGVECGIFAGHLPGLDCVSYGPDMKDIHTPKESMNAQSVERTWEYTLEILKRLQ